MELDFEKDLRIDEDALDIEFLNQPNLYFKYSREQARAKAELERIKQSYEIARADLASSIRRNPDDYGLLKATNDAVEEVILKILGSNRGKDLGKNFRDAKEALLQTQENYDLINASLRAIEQRKSSLENLVKLMLGNYFSAPLEPRNLSDEVRKSRQAEEADDKIAERLATKPKPSRRKK